MKSKESIPSVLNRSVSLFAHAKDTAPATVNLLAWLTEPNLAQLVVDAVRSSKDKFQRDQLKKQLPSITPSGTFSSRSKAGLLQHSGLIAFDIDNLGDSIHDVKQTVANIPNVAYCALSVSGTGLWGLIPVSQPDKHEQHFNAIQIAFKGVSITIDPSCKDVSRLRFYSYDPEPYINHDAVVFDQVYTPQVVPYIPARYPSKSSAPIDRAVNMVLSSRDGEKWDTLRRAAFFLGGYVGGGQVGYEIARSALCQAIEQRGAADIEAAYQTIEGALRRGMDRPIIPNQ